MTDKFRKFITFPDHLYLEIEKLAEKNYRTFTQMVLYLLVLGLRAAKEDNSLKK